MATCADLMDVALPPEAAEDSVSILPLLRGRDQPVRDTLVHHSIQGKFAIREKRWKLVLCPGSGGIWSLQDKDAIRQGLPLVQLYNMERDPGEQTNLESSERETVRRMIRSLEHIVARGRSTPGRARQNDVPVDIWKLDTLPGVDVSTLDDY
jgi:arylsulfatase A-like enzyme